MRFGGATIISFGLLVGTAYAQPPQAETPDTPPTVAATPGQVCLSNACGGTVVDFTGRTRARTVDEAIALGNGQAVRDLGGTAAQAMAALLRRIQARGATTPPEEQASFQFGMGLMSSFVDTSDGSTLSFGGPEGGDGPDVVGSVVRRAPDGSERRIFLNSDGGGTLSETFSFQRPPAP